MNLYSDRASAPLIIPCGAWLRRLKTATLQVRRHPAPEATHQLRVASARLRVWLQMGPQHDLEPNLRWLRHRLSRVRDLDVRIASGPPPVLEKRWRKKRDQARRRVLAKLEVSRLHNTFDSLAGLPPLSLQGATKATRAWAAEALGMRSHWSDLDSVHRLRRVIRRLRYALEWQRKDAADFIALQEALGAVCDAVITLMEVNRHSRYRRRLKHDRNAATKRAHRLWKTLQPHLEALTR